MKIQLIGSNAGYLTLKDNISIPLSFGLSDIRDLNSLSSTFSKTVKIPGTKENNQLLGHYYNVNTETGSFNHNILQRCNIIGDSGEVLLENAVFQLKQVIKVNNTDVNFDAVEYEVLIKDTVGDLFTNISDKKLDLLSFNEGHRYDLTTVTASWSHTFADVYKYILPYIDELGFPTDNQFKLTELKPAIFARAYWDKIFQSNGYTYTWDEIGDFNFNQLLIPYNGDIPKLSDEAIDILKVVAELNTPTSNIFVGASFNNDVVVSSFLYPDSIGRNQYIIDTELSDINNLYNPITGIFQPNYDAQIPGGIDFEFEINYEVIFTNSEGSNVQLKPLNISNPITGPIAKFTVLSSIGNNTQLNNTDYNIASFTLNRDYTLPPGNTTVYTGINTFTQTVTNINSFNNLITQIGFKAEGFVAGLQSKWYKPGGAGADVSIGYSIKINSVKVKIIPNSNNGASYGSIIDLNQYIPKNIKQADFIKGICKMYNLFIIPDPNNTTNVIIKQRDTFYDEGVIKDWTNKLAKDIDQEISFLSDITAKEIKLTYKQDNDPANEGYYKNTNEIFGEYKYTFENQYVKNNEEKTLVFSPTPNLKTSFGAYLPYINGAAPKNNIRVLIDGGNLSCSEYSIFDTGSISSSYTSYPYTGMLNHPTESSRSIFYGTPDYLFYSDFGNITPNNLFNTYWFRTFNQINSGKMLTAFFNLSDSDINSLKLNDKIYLKQYEAYFVINRIIDYEVSSNRLTQVELITVDNEITLQPSVTQPSNPGLGDLSSIQANANYRFEHLNSNISGNSITIIGFDNYISNGGSTQYIIGSKNFINGTNSYIVGNNNNTNWDNTTVIGDNFLADNNNYTQLPYNTGLPGTLLIDNKTGGTDINITNGDKIIADDGGSIVIEAADSVNSVSSIYTINPGLTTNTVSEPGVGDITTILQSTFKINIASINTINGTVSSSNYVPNGSTHSTEDITTGDICTLGIGINDIQLSAFNGTTNEISTITQTPQGIGQLVDLDGTFNDFVGVGVQWNAFNVVLENNTDGRNGEIFMGDKSGFENLRLSFGDNGFGASIIIATGVITQQHYGKKNTNLWTVTTTDATVTNLTTYTPIGIAPVFTVEYDVYGFEPATGDAIGAKAFATFKVVGGVVIQVGTTSIDRKSDFPGVVTALIDTDGTTVRFRVQGEIGRTIDWKGGYTINN